VPSQVFFSCGRLGIGVNLGFMTESFEERHPYVVSVKGSFDSRFSNIRLACETAATRGGSVVDPEGKIIGSSACRMYAHQ